MRICFLYVVMTSTLYGQTSIDVYANPNSFDVPAMKAGDPPPRFMVNQWIQGEIDSLWKPGHVYVIEFWASWCQPCRKAIPHLNRLHGELSARNVHIIGIAASETGNSTALEKLVKKKGNELTYSVAYTTDSLTFVNWMHAARNSGLPWAFVIDRQGRIVWWGQPFNSRFESVVRSVADDTYVIDPALQEMHVTNRVALWSMQSRFWEAFDVGQWDICIGIADTLQRETDEVFYYEIATAFDIIYSKMGNRAEAMSQLAALESSQLWNTKPEVFYVVARTILREDKSDDLPVGLRVAERANTLTRGETPEILRMLGTYHRRLGNKEVAMNFMMKAMEKADHETLRADIDRELQLMR